MSSLKKNTMKKSILLFLYPALACLNAFSQVELRYGAEMDSGWGDANSVVTPYVSFPTEFIESYAGNRITKVMIGLQKKATNGYLYIKHNPEDPQYIYRQKLGDLTQGWNEIILETPYEITGLENIAIGYKGSFAEAGGVGYSNEKFTNGDKVYYNSQDRWTSTGGSICIKALVEGDAMPQNEMMISRITDRTAPYEAESVPYTVVVRNVGANTVYSYSLAITVNGVSENLLRERNLMTNRSDTVIFDVPSAIPGRYDVSVSVEKVNGTEDHYPANNTTSAVLTVRDKAFARRIVCEEHTGIWCGFCPRGIVGLELMKEAHPDHFIPICIHSGDDPMVISPDTDYSYSMFIESCVGAPYCNVNRRLSGDPYLDIDRLYKLESESENHIAIETSASWNNDGTISVKSIYLSDIDIETPALSIAYTLTEDGIRGYAQTNYYAGGRNGEMYGWEEKTDPAVDVTFNDVARGIFGGYTGMPLPTEPMRAYTRYKHEYTIQVPPSVSDKTKLHVIGQIIDSKSNQIQNAMSTSVEGDIPNHVENIGIDLEAINIHTSNGLMTITGKEIDGSKMRIADICGNTVFSTTLSGDSNIIDTRLNGFYIIVIEKNNIIKSFKIIL